MTLCPIVAFLDENILTVQTSKLSMESLNLC